MLSDGPTRRSDGFPHIPYYAIGCTLDDIADRSGGRMSVEVIGKSALGRDMYGVVINRPADVAREAATYRNWLVGAQARRSRTRATRSGCSRASTTM